MSSTQWLPRGLTPVERQGLPVSHTRIKFKDAKNKNLPVHQAHLPGVCFIRAPIQGFNLRLRSEL